MTSQQPPAFRNQTQRGLFRRTPPAIFPVILGLLGLGLLLAGLGGLLPGRLPGPLADGGPLLLLGELGLVFAGLGGVVVAVEPRVPL